MLMLQVKWVAFQHIAEGEGVAQDGAAGTPIPGWHLALAAERQSWILWLRFLEQRPNCSVQGG